MMGDGINVDDVFSQTVLDIKEHKLISHDPNIVTSEMPCDSCQSTNKEYNKLRHESPSSPFDDHGTSPKTRGIHPGLTSTNKMNMTFTYLSNKMSLAAHYGIGDICNCGDDSSQESEESKKKQLFKETTLLKKCAKKDANSHLQLKKEKNQEQSILGCCLLGRNISSTSLNSKDDVIEHNLPESYDILHSASTTSRSEHVGVDKKRKHLNCEDQSYRLSPLINGKSIASSKRFKNENIYCEEDTSFLGSPLREKKLVISSFKGKRQDQFYINSSVAISNPSKKNDFISCLTLQVLSMRIDDLFLPDLNENKGPVLDCPFPKKSADISNVSEVVRRTSLYPPNTITIN